MVLSQWSSFRETLEPARLFCALLYLKYLDQITLSVSQGPQIQLYYKVNLIYYQELNKQIYISVDQFKTIAKVQQLSISLNIFYCSLQKIQQRFCSSLIERVLALFLSMCMVCYVALNRWQNTSASTVMLSTWF